MVFYLNKPLTPALLNETISHAPNPSKRPSVEFPFCVDVGVAVHVH